MIISEQYSAHNIERIHTTPKIESHDDPLLCFSAFSKHLNHPNWLSGLYRAVTLQRIAPTYEKFRKNVGVRRIRRGYVFHRLRTRYHTLAFAGVRCHTSNLSKNFVHTQNFQRMPTYYTLDIR